MSFFFCFFFSFSSLLLSSLSFLLYLLSLLFFFFLFFPAFSSFFIKRSSHTEAVLNLKRRVYPLSFFFLSMTIKSLGQLLLCVVLAPCFSPYLHFQSVADSHSKVYTTLNERPICWVNHVHLDSIYNDWGLPTTWYWRWTILRTYHIPRGIAIVIFFPVAKHRDSITKTMILLSLRVLSPTSCTSWLGAKGFLCHPT